MASQDEILEQILDLPGNRVGIPHLVRSLKEGNVVLVVGDGLSVPLGYPRWRDFLLNLARTFAGLPPEKYTISELELVVQLRQAMGPLLFYDAVEEEYGPPRSQDRPVRGPVAMLPKLARSSVITTNIDSVLEHVLTGWVVADL